MAISKAIHWFMELHIEKMRGQDVRVAAEHTKRVSGPRPIRPGSHDSVFSDIINYLTMPSGG